MKELIAIRHAQSEWNAAGLFTGWANPALSALGVKEAHRAAKLLKEKHCRFDHIYSSVLQRAVHTAELIQDQLNLNLSLEKDWRLNERHYGALQGKNKAALKAQAGENQIQQWRRAYALRPPALSLSDPRHPRFDPLYLSVAAESLPATESLADTRLRVMEFWQEKIIPALQRNESILLSAHGNTLRALLMDLSAMSASAVENLEIPTATPLVLTFDEELNFLEWRYLSADGRQMSA